MRFIRWKAVAALLFFAGCFGILWALFADRIIRETSEEAASEMLGVEVSIGALRILETEAAVEVDRFTVADPFNRDRNLIEFDEFRFDVDPEPLIGLKLVVDQATLAGVRFAVPRETPARVYERGLAQNVMATVTNFTSQFDVPLLSLTPVDTIQAVIADPSQLKSMQAADALSARAAAGRAAVDSGVQGLRIQPALDSARAIGARTARVNLRDLDAARRAAADLRRGIDSLDRAKQRVTALGRSAQARLDSLQAGLRALDAARQQDYAFARSLLKLPSFSGPDLSRALFGPVSIDRFQQALYWTSVAREYAPPGLKPRENPGPARMRRSGTTVRFPIPEDIPGFLVRKADLSMTAGGADQRANAFALSAANITSDPALTGVPMTANGSGEFGGESPVRVALAAVLDHATAQMRDSVSATVSGVPLPDFKVPGLPFSAALDRGTVGLGFRLDGDRVEGRWTLRTEGVAWRPDSGRALAPREALVARVLEGVRSLDVDARIGGTISAPTLSISSNLGDVLAGRMREIVGEEAARAEAKLRAEVDRQVGPKIAAARAQVTALQATVNEEVTAAQGRIDAERKALQDRLSGIRLPGGLRL
jgi:uncharacterized protein (TIGR03545 family)